MLVYPLCWPWRGCTSNCTFTPCFFRSRYTRAATLLSVSQASKWFLSMSLWSLKSKSPVISTWLSKESALPGVFVTSRVLEEGSLRRPMVADGCLHHRRGGIKLSLRTCFSNSRVLRLKTFPEKVLVVSNHALLKSFVQRKKQRRTFDYV